MILREILWFIATLAIIFRILGMFGIGEGFGLGGLIHLLLVIAIIIILYNIISGRKPMD